jgi:hypothetical protein
LSAECQFRTRAHASDGVLKGGPNDPAFRPIDALSFSSFDFLLDFGGKGKLSDPQKLFKACCKDMATALSFPDGRHFFVDGGALKLLVAKARLADGQVAELEHPVRFCPFCGKPMQSAVLG